MIKQISVFLPNVPNILSKLTEVLLEKDINIRAISVADTSDYGILRLLVDKPDECIEILKTSNYLVSITEVIAVAVADKPGSLHMIAKALGSANINIEYIYSVLAVTKHEAIIIIRIDDNKKAVEVLKGEGLALLDTADF